MDFANLKIVSIYSRTYKRHLLLNKCEVASLKSHIQSIIQHEVMVINTNIGLDIYYYASEMHFKLIRDAFLLLVEKQINSTTNFHFKSLNTKQDIIIETENMFHRLSTMPLLYKSYCKSLFFQFDLYASDNKAILNALFSIWKEVLWKLVDSNSDNKKFKMLLSDLQQSYIHCTDNHNVKVLLEKALSPIRQN